MKKSLLSALLAFAVFLFAHLASAESEVNRSPIVVTVQDPVSVVDLGNGKWFFDFGKDAFGNVFISAPGNSDGACVTVCMGEAAEGYKVIPNENENIRYQSHQLVLSENKPVSPALTWAPPSFLKDGWMTSPDGAEEIMPFRYVEVENAPEGFSAECIRRKIYHVPFNEEASKFESTNEGLDKVWDFCKYSIKATSAFGLYVDGDRERKPYEADALINQLGHYCVDADYDTGRYTLEYLLDHPTWPTEWQFQVLMMAWNDYMWSGDDSFIREHYDVLKERVMLDRRTSEGLFQGFPFDWSKPMRDIVDWPDVERDGYDMTVEVNTVVTAYYYHSLRLLQKMAGHLGKPEESEAFSRLADATCKAFNELFWDEQRGVYVDGLGADGKPSAHAASHANFFPLAFDLVPPERIPKVAAYLKEKGMVCSVYGAQFLLEALFKAGEADYAIRLITSRGTRSWLNMMDQVGSTITMEAWDPSLKPNLDWNHAWGAAPANIIMRCMVGIEPLEPGFRRFRIYPQMGDESSVNVWFPLPEGLIELNIKRVEDLEEYTLNVPKGYEGELYLPDSWARLEASSGAPEVLRRENGFVVVRVTPGCKSFILKK